MKEGVIDFFKGTVFRAEGMASTEASRQEHSCHVQEIAKRTVWPVDSEQGERSR